MHKIVCNRLSQYQSLILGNVGKNFYRRLKKEMYQPLILGNVGNNLCYTFFNKMYQSLILGNVGMVTVDQDYKDTEYQSLILGNVATKRTRKTTKTVSVSIPNIR